jgi:SAM-dependent methyltransferase
MKQIFQTEEFAKAWNDYQSRKDPLRTELMNPILVNEIGNLSGHLVLDAGCGNGIFKNNLVNSKSRLFVEFDISAHLARIAKTNQPSSEVVVADIVGAIPYKSSSFDVVICYNVLMELPDVQRAVNELARVTKSFCFIHVVIVHPLYHLFVNDRRSKDESIFERLQRYSQDELIYLTTIPGFDNFAVHRRSISTYVNHFIRSKLTIKKMLEIPISEAVAKEDPKFTSLIGVPVFIYFKLERLA